MYFSPVLSDTHPQHQSLVTTHNSNTFLTWASSMEILFFLAHARQNTLLLKCIISIKERKV